MSEVQATCEAAAEAIAELEAQAGGRSWIERLLPWTKGKDE